MRLIVDGFGKTISKRDNQIVIKENGKETDFFLAKDLSNIVITGKGHITFDAFHLLASNNVEVLCLDWRGHVNFRLVFPDSKNVIAKREQYAALNDYRSGIIAKKLINAKIRNQKAVLGTLAKSKEDSEFIRDQRDKVSQYLDKINNLPDVSIANIRSSLFGIEGMASVEYWKGFANVVDDSFNFTYRSGKNAQDGINSLLNYSYAVLTSEVYKDISIVGLDPYAGYLHTDKIGKASLVYDLMEVFRQQIADKSVLAMVNRKQIKPGDFILEDGYCRIKDKPRQELISTILTKLSQKIKYEDKKISYSDIIYKQTLNLRKFLVENKEFKEFYLRW